MKIDDIIKDLDDVSKRHKKISEENKEKAYSYVKILNEMYSKYIDQYIEWKGVEYYNTQKGGFFGGFKTYCVGMSEYVSIIPIVYQVKKDGTKSTRVFTTFEKDIEKVIKLLK